MAYPVHRKVKVQEQRLRDGIPVAQGHDVLAIVRPGPLDLDRRVRLPHVVVHQHGAHDPVPIRANDHVDALVVHHEVVDALPEHVAPCGRRGGHRNKEVYGFLLLPRLKYRAIERILFFFFFMQPWSNSMDSYLAREDPPNRGLQPDREAYEDVLKKVSTSMPDKYVPRSLSPKDRATQRRNILKSRAAYKQGKYLSRPKVKSFKSKPSRHVVKAKKMYGIESMTDLDALHRATGCSRSSMEKILNKGRGAFYSSGSRPNQSAESWALARLASAVTAARPERWTSTSCGKAAATTASSRWPRALAASTGCPTPTRTPSRRRRRGKG